MSSRLDPNGKWLSSDQVKLLLEVHKAAKLNLSNDQWEDLAETVSAKNGKSARERFRYLTNHLKSKNDFDKVSTTAGQKRGPEDHGQDMPSKRVQGQPYDPISDFRDGNVAHPMQNQTPNPMPMSRGRAGTNVQPTQWQAEDRLEAYEDKFPQTSRMSAMAREEVVPQAQTRGHEAAQQPTAPNMFDFAQTQQQFNIAQAQRQFDFGQPQRQQTREDQPLYQESPPPSEPLFQYFFPEYPPRPRRPRKWPR